jgi:hypothetical protein
MLLLHVRLTGMNPGAVGHVKKPDYYHLVHLQDGMLLNLNHPCLPFSGPSPFNKPIYADMTPY